jgi:hypothetical protein
MASSIIWARRSPLCCPWRVAPTARKVFLDLDDLSGLVEFVAQSVDLPLQPDDLTI